MSNPCKEQLQKLNMDTFAAEARRKIGEETWDVFLTRVLAPDFILRRAGKGKLDERKGRMIEVTSGAPIRHRIVEEPVTIWCNETLGVVTCSITLDPPAPDTTNRFQNTKVFKKAEGGDWQCVYWQVTEVPAQ
jgi:hypothetical protein